MAGFVALGNNSYIGTLKLATGQSAVKNGAFVVADWSAGTASISVSTTPEANEYVPYFVENVIDTVDEQQINDIDFTTVAGQYLRLKRLLAGEIFVTDQVTGTPAVGDILDIGFLGKIAATTTTPLQQFQVIEKPTMWGVTCYKCIVLK